MQMSHLTKAECKDKTSPYKCGMQRQHLTLQIQNAKTISHLTNAECKDNGYKLSSPNSQHAAKNYVEIFCQMVKKLVVAALNIYFCIYLVNYSSNKYLCRKSVWL